MRRHLFAVLFLVTSVFASDKPEPWVEVRSPHFVVVTNANEKQARSVADQFERMRSVFHTAFPKLAIDSFAPITVVAVKDEKNFRALEPEAYLAKGSLKLGGLFIHGSEKNYVLMRLDTGYEHPYSVVYHEYTHLLTSKASEYMPLWLNEGFAEFYENTDIHDKDVSLGQPSQQNIYLLREHRLLPLEQLFSIGHDSPYYHEQDKGSIFYAESWVLTHFLTMNDFKSKGHRIRDYLDLLSQKVDPVTAATTAFGDLKQLQKALEAYVGQFSFQYFKMQASSDIDPSAFTARPLTASQAAVVRADFLAYNQRTNDARALLEQAMRDDAGSAAARETLGFLEAMQGHKVEARKWYEEAVKLDSQSYLAHYYFAAMAMNSELNAEDEARVEASLRAAIKLNPAFAPAYDRLAVFYGTRRKNLQEAYLLSLNAVQDDPSNIFFRINSANVLMAAERADDALRVLETASKLAKDEGERSSVESMVRMVESYRKMRDQVAEHNRAIAEANADRPVLQNATSKDEEAAPPKLASRMSTEFPPRGPRKSVIGKVSDVQCSMPAVLEAKVSSSAGTTQLHSDNYYRIQFSALGFTPSGELHPCSDLEGATAKVEYVDSSGTSLIISVELRK
jgi:tetratricopeptide (TPR) repeat protein